MPGGQRVRMDVAHIALLPDQIYDLGRHLHIPIGFVGLRDLFYDPLIVLIDDHI